jgi:hypothetical protein
MAADRDRNRVAIRMHKAPNKAIHNATIALLDGVSLLQWDI